MQNVRLKRDQNHLEVPESNGSLQKGTKKGGIKEFIIKYFLI